ncbi:hypothetical protein CLCR_11293 [Cladophialophora carrionii]|uniref:Uncharacterized protein n=1 Tax=Cladophialophora carrionii TaxID=86049 RepID=A0A1C1CJ86_9EURO|nr:hypothetical protein CLCR_11293 [Cladophialophora carrionii]
MAAIVSSLGAGTTKLLGQGASDPSQLPSGLQGIQAGTTGLFGHGAFDPSQFPSEVQEMEADHNSSIGDSEYEALMQLLKHLTESAADVSHDPNLEHGMEELAHALQAIETSDGTDFNEELITTAVHTLQSEGHCENIFAFLEQLHHDGVDFGDDELHTIIANISGLFTHAAGQAEQGGGAQPSLMGKVSELFHMQDGFKTAGGQH